MIIDPKKTTVAYRCPVCGGGVMAPVGVFSLSGERMRLKCPCGSSAMNISKTRDGKVRLDTPCLACGTNHSCSISTNVFFTREIFSLPCSMSGLDICFFGHEDKVSSALSEQEKELRAMMMGEEEEDYTPELNEEDREELLKAIGKINDAEIYDIIKFILMELEEDGKITCGCKHGEGEYDVDCSNDKVKVFCSKCTRYKDYPISSVSDAEKFLQIDEINL